MLGRHNRNKVSKQVHRTRKFWLNFTTVLASLAVAGGTAGYFVLHTPLDHFKRVSAQPKTKAVPNATPKPVKTADRINVLLIGTDSRPGDRSGNTDVLILASIDNLHKRIELMSIPRDTRVEYPDGHEAKINQSLNLGGPELTIELAENLLKQPVDYYALTHFDGLVGIIDTIGGLEVNVKQRMYYNTGDQKWNLINLRPGTQTLNGTQALGFVRFRHDALGDIGRTERQQEFLSALSKRLLQTESVKKLPTLIHQFWSTIDTNMSVIEMSDIAANARRYENYQVIHETIPGSFHNPDPTVQNDQSYWEVNPNQISFVAKQFFENGVVQSNPIQDPNTTSQWKPPIEEASVDTPFMTVNIASVKVRSGPGSNYRVLSTVSYGQVVRVVGREGEWSRLQFPDGQIGYVEHFALAAKNT